MKVLTLAAFLLLSSVAFAFNVQFDRETLVAPIDSTNRAEIFFSGASADDTITLSLVGEKPWMLLTPTQFALRKGENVTVSLFASPKGDTPLGLYRVRIMAESTVKERKTTDLYISVERESGVYIERIIVTGDLAPTGLAHIEFHLKNYGMVTMNDISLSANIQGKDPVSGFSETVNNVNPLKTIIIEKTITLPERLVAGEYVVDAKISYKDISRDFQTKFAVSERAIINKEVVDYTPSFAGYSKTVKITNKGNKDGDYTLTEAISSFDAVFYSGTNPTSAGSGQYAWNAVLKPGETATISYRVDYMPLVLFLLAILVFSWYIIVKLRTIRITKFIMQKRMIEEGSEFTIGLELKNAIGTNVQDVVVRDFVPSVFDVKEGEGPRPVKRKAAHGTELEWKINELFSKEDRILSYKIVPVFGVHGQIALPQATTRFKFGNRAIENKSNVTAVGVASKEKGENLEDIFSKKKK